MAICSAIEKRGVGCWISSLDVGPGENFQDSIYRAIGQTRVMVLVFSQNANNSDEIKKEIALAGQHKLVVIPLRIEDVLPSSAFAYELATRQWINLFEDWNASIERVIEQIDKVLAVEPPTRGGGDGGGQESPSPRPPIKRDEERSVAKYAIVAMMLVALAVIGGGAYAWHRSTEDARLAAEEKARQERLAADEAARQKAAQEAALALAAAQKAAADKAAADLAAAQKAALEKAAAEKAAADKAEADRIAAEKAEADRLAAEKANAEQQIKNKQLAALEAPAPPVAPPSKPSVLDAPPPLAEIGVGGQVFRDCADCPEMVTVGAGKAVVGSATGETGRSPSEGPQQVVAFARPFAVGRTDVTFEEWDACVASGGCNAWQPGDYGWGRGRLPVIFVSWNDANAYAEWLSKKTGKPYRLMSEAEYEFVARACRSADCSERRFWFGNAIQPEYANYNSQYSYDRSPKAQPRRRTLAVDASPTNPFGLYQILGNVRRWMADCWNPTLDGLPKDGSARTTGDCASRVLRGGSWSDEPGELRASARSWDDAKTRNAQTGFRLARDLTP